MSDQYTVDQIFVQAIFDEALRLASLGYPVHPVHGITPQGICTCGKGAGCPTPGKHPVLSGWQKQASTDPAVISSWPWGAGYNLGIVTGETFTILDFDGPDGLETLEALVKWCPALENPAYGLLMTGSGGVHLVGRGTSNSTTRRLPGMDVRGVGGQAVVAPSRHFSGGVYSGIRPLEAMVPEFPPEVLAVARGELVPIELAPPDRVTLDDLKILAKKQSKYQSPLKALVAGEPFAQPGERDTILTGLVGVIVSKWPKLDPIQAAKHFEKSIAAMSIEPKAPTMEQVIEKLQRFRQMEEENQSAQPQISIGVDIPDMSRQGMDAVAKAERRSLYRRGYRLVYVSFNEKLPGLLPRDEDRPMIVPATPGVVRGELSMAARWHRRNRDGDVVPKKPPQDVTTYITDIGEWSQLPYLEGLVSGPFLRMDGTICPGGGYDESTGLYSVGRPMQGEVIPLAQALAELGEVFYDFPFKNTIEEGGQGHYSAALAAILTGAARYAFKGPSPLFLIDANTRGAGKTLLANVIGNIISLGGVVGAGIGHDNEEDRKQITSLAMDGAQTILVDNITGKFGTSKLCEALSLHNGIWSDRVLGKNKTWSGAFRPVWLGTGNNVQPRPDVERRVCYCRLESPLEKPELRTGFKYPSLMGYVIENRDRLFLCALSILKHFWDAGKPGAKGLPAWGGFEDWSELIRGAVVWCGFPDPVQTRAELALSDEDHDYGRILVEGVAELVAASGGPVRCADIISAVYKVGQLAADQERFSDFREAIETLCWQRNGTPTPQGLGKVLRKYRGRVFEGRSLKQCGKHLRSWMVV